MSGKYIKTIPKHRFYQWGDVYFKFEKSDSRYTNFYSEVGNGIKFKVLVLGALLPSGSIKISEDEWNDKWNEVNPKGQ